MDYDRGTIIGLYNFVYNNQRQIIEMLSEHFLLNSDDITIKLRTHDLSIIVCTSIPTTQKNGSFSIFIVNRLDEYIYNFDDYILLNKFLLLFKNDKRKKIIKELKA
jgi:hypothetical protein